MTTSAINEAKDNALSGMNAIRDFNRSINLASSEASVIQMVRESGFPAKKIGGIWESDKRSIIAWRVKYINGEVTIRPEKKRAKKK
ncbi:MAG: hypothetical protein ABFD76_11815 [Smithella sp.]